jgi:hypothetical protein
MVQALVGGLERKEAQGWGVRLGAGPQGGLNIRLGAEKKSDLGFSSSQGPVSHLEFEDLQLDHNQAQACKLELQELLGL